MAESSRFLPDTNTWLALALSGHPHHALARQWLDAVDDRSEIILCRAVQQSLLRLLTTAAVFAPLGDDPLTNREAWAVADAFAADARVSVAIFEPAAVSSGWREFSSLGTSSPKVWMDAYLAAFALRSDATLVTNDRAFAGFQGLRSLILGQAAAS
ncbi:MAG: PIN domain-containing protein [Microbacterium sp.]